MANLEHRIADLEAASPPRKDPIVIFIEGVPRRDRPLMGEIIGVNGVAKRQRGESEKEFLERAKAGAGQIAVQLLIERSTGEGQSPDA